MSEQNKTHAVMSQRHEDQDSLDYFPTPPWATRALFEHILKPNFIYPQQPDDDFIKYTCLEPACGAGHMAKVLEEYFPEVMSCDIADYGQDRIADFLSKDVNEQYDFIITTPPFNLAEEFVLKALPLAKESTAIFARTQFIESVGRYERLFKQNPPTIIAQFTERVPIIKGRLSANASTATSYAWFIWESDQTLFKNPFPKFKTEVQWIPPTRAKLERRTDYEESVATPHPRPTRHASQGNLFD